MLRVGGFTAIGSMITRGIKDRPKTVTEPSCERWHVNQSKCRDCYGIYLRSELKSGVRQDSKVITTVSLGDP